MESINATDDRTGRNSNWVWMALVVGVAVATWVTARALADQATMRPTAGPDGEAASGRGVDYTPADRLMAPAGRVDHLDTTDSADGFGAGAFDGTAFSSGAVRPEGRSSAAAAGEGSGGELGTWTSPVVETVFPTREVLPSWNVDAPAGTGVRFHVRVRQSADGSSGKAGGDAAAGDGWSPYVYLGSWGDLPPNVVAATDDSAAVPEKSAPGPRDPTDGRGQKRREFDGGRVFIDVLILARPADAYQVRATFYGPADAAEADGAEAGTRLSLRRLVVATSGPVPAPADATDPRFIAASPDLPAGTAPAWSGVLDVPFFAQYEAPDEAVRGEVCSPTSTTMVTSFQGEPRPPEENYRAILDPDTGIYGNWNRAVARAGQLGLDSWLRRFRSMDEVKAELAAGRPVIASIKFKAGEFPSSVSKKSNGHLLVVRGFTPGGDPVVNDPASRARGEGAVYKADELANAWFNNSGGVGYVIRRPAGE